MSGYVAQRRGRFYPVIYEGRDPLTGKEIHGWHPAGTDRASGCPPDHNGAGAALSRPCYRLRYRHPASRGDQRWRT